MAQAPGQPWILLVEPLHTPQAMPSLLLPPSGPREARVDAEQVRPAKDHLWTLTMAGRAKVSPGLYPPPQEIG